MSKRHFIAIAAELRRQRPCDPTIPYETALPWMQGAYDEWATIVIGMAGVLAEFNPMFKRGTFLAACGMGDA